MVTVQVENLYKTFGETKAVQGASFEVRKGEIFGLIGPNGAGKTTIIRIILDIFKPEKGWVKVFGDEVQEEILSRIGYMPEERGLYQDDVLDRCLTYLSTLKGLETSEVKKRLDQQLEAFGLAEHRKKKVKELSKGMQQKAQIINTILHDPELIIIDEPFTALDPINTQMVKNMMLDLRSQGKTIIMSTHQMNQVEALCDRIVLIDEGKVLLYGELEQIRRQFSGRDLLVKVPGELPRIRGIENLSKQNGVYQITLDEQTSPQTVLERLVFEKTIIEKFEVALPGVDEIFIRVVEGEGSNA